EIGSYLSGLGINNYKEYQLNYQATLDDICQSALNETIVAGSMYMIGGIKKLLNDSPNIYWEHLTH
ncbi:MAG: hypothetical protein WD512_03705, partial [Candidatus Paceibacterota bacterium]